MAKRVTSTAVTACIFGTRPSALIVDGSHCKELEGNNVANISDHLPFYNILPFGLCTSPANPMVAAAQAPVPCIPMTFLPWIEGNKSIVLDGHNTLDNISVCPCLWKGIIGILYPGQGSEFCAVTGGKEPTLEEQKVAVAKALDEFKSTEEGKLAYANAEQIAKDSYSNWVDMPTYYTSVLDGALYTQDEKRKKGTYLITVTVNPKWRRIGLGKPTEDISTLIRMSDETTEKVVGKIIQNYTPSGPEDVKVLPEKFTNWETEVKDPALVEEAKKSLELDNADDLNSGWIYVFAQSGDDADCSDFTMMPRFFREYQVVRGGSGSSYCEVFFSMTAGYDSRSASTSGSRIELPYQYETVDDTGKVTKTSKFKSVYVMYSPTQLSWARICKFGGISQGDSRLEYLAGTIQNIKIKEAAAYSVDTGLRDKRFGQPLKQDELDNLYSVQHGKGQPEPKESAGTDSVTAWQETSIFYNKDYTPVLLLSDPAGEVLQGNILITNLFGAFNQIMDEMRFLTDNKAVIGCAKNVLNSKMEEAVDDTDSWWSRLWHDKKEVNAVIEDMTKTLNTLKGNIQYMTPEDKAELNSKFQEMMSKTKLLSKADKAAKNEDFKKLLDSIPSGKPKEKSSFDTEGKTDGSDNSREISYDALSALIAFMTFVKKDYPGIVYDEAHFERYFMKSDSFKSNLDAKVPWTDAAKSLDMKKINFFLRKDLRECLHKLIASVQRTNTDIMLGNVYWNSPWKVDIYEEIRDYFAKSDALFGQGYNAVWNLISSSCNNSRNVDAKLRANDDYINRYWSVHTNATRQVHEARNVEFVKIYSRLSGSVVAEYSIDMLKNKTTCNLIAEEHPAGYDFLVHLQESGFALYESMFNLGLISCSPGTGMFNKAALIKAGDKEKAAGNILKYSSIMLSKPLEGIVKSTYDAYCCKYVNAPKTLTLKVGTFKTRMYGITRTAFGNEHGITDIHVREVIKEAKGFYAEFEAKSSNTETATVKKSTNTKMLEADNSGKIKKITAGNAEEFETKTIKNVTYSGKLTYDSYKTMRKCFTGLQGVLFAFAILDINEKLRSIPNEVGRFDTIDSFKAKVALTKTFIDTVGSMNTVKGEITNILKSTGATETKLLKKWIASSVFKSLKSAPDVLGAFSLVSYATTVGNDVLALTNTITAAGRMDKIKMAVQSFQLAGHGLITSANILKAAKITPKIANGKISTGVVSEKNTLDIARGVQEGVEDSSKIATKEALREVGVQAGEASIELLGVTLRLSARAVLVIEFLASPEMMILMAAAELIISCIIKQLEHSTYRIWAENSTLGTEKMPYASWMGNPGAQYASLVSLLIKPVFNVNPNDKLDDGHEAVSVNVDASPVYKFIGLDKGNFVFENIWLCSRNRRINNISTHEWSTQKGGTIVENMEEHYKPEAENTVYYRKDKLKEKYEIAKTENDYSSINEYDLFALHLIPAGHLDLEGITVPSQVPFPGTGVIDKAKKDAISNVDYEAGNDIKKIAKTNWLGDERIISDL